MNTNYINFIITLLLTILSASHSNAQNAVVLKGTVSDNITAIPFAVVEIKSLKDTNFLQQTPTDSLGYYQFTIRQYGKYKILVSALGYKDFVSDAIVLEANKTYDIMLVEEHTHLEEVVVVGKVDKARNSALDMKIINKQYLEQNKGGSLIHSIEKIPGVNMIGIGAGQAKPMIRGMGFDRLLVIDKGVKHEAQQWGVEHGLEIDQFAVNELEIIKGPASFLYGSNAVGGVIKINPERPPNENTFGGYIELTSRSNNGFLGTALNIYGRKKKWFASGGLSYQDYGDYKVPTDTVFVYDYPVHLYNRQVRNTAGKQAGIHFNTGYLGEKFSSVFYVSNVYSRNGFFANAHGLEPKNVDTPLYDKSSRDILDPSDQVNHFKIINRSLIAFKDHYLEIESGFQINFRQEFFNYVPHGYMPVFYPDTLSIPKNLERQYAKNVFSLNATDRFSIGKHSLQFGINSEYQKNRIDGYGFLVPSFNQFSIGAFAYDKIQLTDRLLLHTALRYDYSNIHIFSYTDWFETPIESNGIVQYEKIERTENTLRCFNSITGAVGLNYNVEDYAFKINFGKSYRTPIAKELAANGVNYHYFSFEKGDKNLKPEESYQLDVSLDYSKKKIAFQISPFVNYFPNYIYQNPTAYHDYQYGAGNQIYQYNQSRVFRTGAEFSVKYQFVESFSAEMSSDYVYSLQISGDKKSYTLPFSPPWSGNINLTYSPEKINRFYNPYFSLDTRLVAPQNNIVPPEKKTEGYVLLNVQSGGHFHFGKQELNINFQIRNLLNTKYMMHTSFYRLIGLPEEGTDFVLSLKMNLDFINNKSKTNE